MSKAAQIFINNMKDIMENGFWDTDLNVRPHWEDGTPAHTVKKFCIVNRYNLQEELPILTIRRTAFKSCLDDLSFEPDGSSLRRAPPRHSSIRCADEDRRMP